METEFRLTERELEEMIVALMRLKTPDGKFIFDERPMLICQAFLTEGFVKFLKKDE